jgi:hypothetical protein
MEERHSRNAQICEEKYDLFGKEFKVHSGDKKEDCANKFKSLLFPAVQSKF